MNTITQSNALNFGSSDHKHDCVVRLLWFQSSLHLLRTVGDQSVMSHQWGLSFFIYKMEIIIVATQSFCKDSMKYCIKGTEHYLVHGKLQRSDSDDDDEDSNYPTCYPPFIVQNQSGDN